MYRALKEASEASLKESAGCLWRSGQDLWLARLKCVPKELGRPGLAFTSSVQL